MHVRVEARSHLLVHVFDLLLLTQVRVLHFRLLSQVAAALRVVFVPRRASLVLQTCAVRLMFYPVIQNDKRLLLRGPFFLNSVLDWLLGNQVIVRLRTFAGHASKILHEVVRLNELFFLLTHLLVLVVRLERSVIQISSL